MSRAVLQPWQRDLLDRCRAGRLGTIGPGGRPHLVPVCYALVGDALVIPVDEKPKRGPDLARARNIARDPRVSLLVDHYEDDWDRLAWVRIDGLARVHRRGADCPGVMAGLRDRYSQYREMALEALPWIEIIPERVVGWRWPAGK